MTEERIRKIAEGDNAGLVMTPEEKIELASALLAALQAKTGKEKGEKDGKD